MGCQASKKAGRAACSVLRVACCVIMSGAQGVESRNTLHKIFAANSANSDRSPFCNSICAATASVRNRLTI
jgi:hypothetical protein